MPDIPVPRFDQFYRHPELTRLLHDYAAALPELPYACGLATVHLFARDVSAHPLLPVDGALPVPRPGEVAPRPGASLGADGETRARWEARLAAVGG